jgi:hypothetical protein
MDQEEYLSMRRKHYMELTKIYLSELQKGSPVQSLGYLKEKMDALIQEIRELEEGTGTDKPVE